MHGEKHFHFKMLITFEPNVAQRSVASQNDHKSKAGLPEASSTAFTMYRRLKRHLRRLNNSKMDPKWQPQLPLIDLSSFPVFLTPCPVRFLWSKMGCTHVPYIVIHFLCSTRTYLDHFRPSEVSFFSYFRGGRQLGNGWVK